MVSYVVGNIGNHAMSHDLEDFLDQMSAEISAEYRRIQRSAQEDPGTAGDEGEENWAQLLRRLLPSKYYVVTKGRILGLDGMTSPQFDVLVLSASYPKGLTAKKKYLAAGVVAAFECKLTIRAEHIKRAMENSAALRAIKRSSNESTKSQIISGLLAHSHSWSKPASRPIDNITSNLHAATKLVHRPSELLDLLCVADLGTWTLMKFPMRSEDRNHPPGNEGQLQLATTYIGPLDPRINTYMAHPVGTMATYLLRRISRADKDLVDIAEYFGDAGLFGTGQGSPIYWPLKAVTDSENEILW
jgi:hypothetical protein